MEEYKTKNKVYNSILEPVITHLEKSKYEVQADSFDILLNKIYDIWENVKKESGEDILIPAAINIFINSDMDIRKTKNPTSIKWRNYVKTLSNALSQIDIHNIYNIKKATKKLHNDLNSLESSFSSDPGYLKFWFQNFCKNLCYLFSLLNKRASETVSKHLSKQILLYIIQLSTCLKVLFQIFTEEIKNKLVIIESRKFIKTRFAFVLNGINSNIEDECFNELNPGFIQWMDNALDLIATLEPNKEGPKNINELKTAVDEVLCHAMSIAQIGAQDDCKKIKGSVQSVLHEFNLLEIEYQKDSLDPSLCNLSLDLVSDKLCLLERRVNTAVLNISMNVFSNAYEPLKNLHKFCEDKTSETRSQEELDNLITNFDSHVDCMMQVGLFAIACSTNVKIISKIRSYLASLENLESEIIPALTSLYMDPSSRISYLHVKILCSHWLQEIQNLRNDVCFIIDPFAFGQVLQEEYKLLSEQLQLTILETDLTLFQNQIKAFCNKVKVFLLVVDASVKDMQLENESETAKHVKHLKTIYKEVCSSTNKLLNNEFKERIVKRLQILFTMIKRVVKSFIEENMNKTVALHRSGKVNLERKIDDIINTTYFKRLENRGLEILKDRSVLYKTPNNKSKLMPFVTPKNLAAPKHSEVRKNGISFLRRQIFSNCNDSVEEEDETMDLQITEILEELTSLAETLRS